MLDRTSKSDIADLRAVLTDAGYDTANLSQLLGSVEPPSASGLAMVLNRTRTPSTINALVRLFLVGNTLPEEELRKVLPNSMVDMCLQSGLLEANEGLLRANIVIVPIENLLFASDAFHKLGSEQSSDFVLPASTRAGNVLRHLTMRTEVGRALDLGCGCGIQALLAARHSNSVVATDISAAAVRYTEFNAMLNNIENIECRQGNLFEPVANEKFDLIISNPPFVVGPSEDFVYRDNSLELDDFCRQIVSEAPTYLTEGGFLQMLCEWVERPEQPWQDRLMRWTQDGNVDTWVLRSPSIEPARYVTRRLTDISGGGFQPGTSYDDWLNYLEQRDVVAIHPGMIALRRRSGDNWFRIYSMTSEPEASMGDSILKSFAANDFAGLCEDDATLLEAVLSISPALQLEQRFSRDDDAWDEGTSVLKLDNPLPMECEVDLPVLAFINQIDGKRTVRESIARFTELTGTDVAELSTQLLPAVRLFISNGFLEPTDA